jgi:hypothetical protein
MTTSNKTPILLAGVCAVLCFPGLALGQKTSQLRVYVAKEDKAPADLDGMSVMVILEPEGGKRQVLRLDRPDGEGKSGVGHGGEVRRGGGYAIELVIAEAGDEHPHEGGTPYFSSKVALSGYTCGMSGHPVVTKPGKCTRCPMKLKPVDLVFSAVVVIRRKGKTTNVKGFKHPPEGPKNYADGIARIEQHIDAIQGLVDAGKLAEVHPVASRISKLCRRLPALAAQGKTEAVEQACKAIIALFPAIDEAGDNGRKADTQAVLDKYKTKLKELKAQA